MHSEIERDTVSSLTTVPTPLPIRIVGILFIVGAIVAVMHILVGLLFQSRLNFDLNVLGFWIGPGLLRGGRAQWVWALVLTWIGQPTLNFFDYKMTPISINLFVAVAVPCELFGIWCVWALYRYSWFTEQSRDGSA